MFPLARFYIIFNSALTLGQSDQVLFDAMLPEVRLTHFQVGHSREGEMDLLIIRFRTRLDKRKTKDAPEVTAPENNNSGLENLSHGGHP